MKSQLRHLLSWWTLDTLALLLIGLLWLVHWLVASSIWRQTLDIILLLVIYGLIDWWIRTHHQDMDEPQIPEQIRTLEMKN